MGRASFTTVRVGTLTENWAETPHSFFSIMYFLVLFPQNGLLVIARTYRISGVSMPYQWV